MSDAPDSMLSRPANPNREKVEVRVNLHPAFVTVLDTEAGNRGLDRTALVRMWLEEKAAEVQRNAIRHANAMRGNPLLSELIESDSDFGAL